jgi:hypothetical protein
VQFKPVSRGTKSGSLVASASNQTVTVSLTGTALTPPQVVMVPQAQSFAGIVGQAGSPVTFTIGNAGDTATGLLTIALGGANAGDFSVASNTCLAPLAAFATCTVKVAFKPVSAGQKAAILSVVASPGGMVHSELTGMAQPAPALSITPASADFGIATVGSTTVAKTFEVKNTGGVATAPLTVTTSTGEFTITANTCGGTSLAPGGTCSLSVQFAPAVIGAKDAILTVAGAAAEIVRAELMGTGIL